MNFISLTDERAKMATKKTTYPECEEGHSVELEANGRTLCHIYLSVLFGNFEAPLSRFLITVIVTESNCRRKDGAVFGCSLELHERIDRFFDEAFGLIITIYVELEIRDNIFKFVTYRLAWEELWLVGNVP